MENLSFIYNRKSVRKFKNIEVKEEDIIKMLDAAIHAPSPKNQQTWHFTVIQNNELINKIADIVTKNHINLAEMAKEEKQRKIMMSLLSYYTCFKNAPVLIIVYSKEYYMIEEKILSDNNASEEVINELRFPNSAAQGIGAAIENFLLAATELGYGTCYMTGPTHSKKEIENLINFEKEEYNFISLTFNVVNTKIKLDENQMVLLFWCKSYFILLPNKLNKDYNPLFLVFIFLKK